jgi:hypothetical protein
MKTKFICVSPVSFKAKVQFCDLMNKFHSCRVLKEDDEKVYLESLNKSYQFWMSLKEDENWKVVK